MIRDKFYLDSIHIKKLGLIWLLVILGPLTTNFVVASDKVINIALGEYPPYYGRNLPGYGEIPKIATAVFGAEGIQVNYHWMPWARAYHQLSEGKFDGSFTGAKTSEREQKFYFSEPLRNNKIVFFHLKDYAFNWESLTDLTHTSIGVTTGYGYSKEFTKAIKDKTIMVQDTPDDLLGFKKILGKRIQIFPISRDVGLFKLKENFDQDDIEKLTFHPLALKDNFVHLILSRQKPVNETLLKRFNQRIKIMEQEGQLSPDRN